MTGSVDIEDLSPVTCHTPVTIPRTVVRAAVAGGKLLITQNGAATVTLVQLVETLRAAFEMVASVVSTIINRGGLFAFCGLFASIRKI